MRSRNAEKSPRAAARGTSNVQRAARSEPWARGAPKRAAPRSKIRAKASKPVGLQPGSLAPVAASPRSAAPEAEEAAPCTPAACQQMYVAACSTGAGGRLVLDSERFARSLADARLGVYAEQQLYHLGLLAAAEEQPSLAAEDVTAALAFFAPAR